MLRKCKNILWTTLGTISLTFGILGIFLPLLPTTPFILITAFCYTKGSPKLYAWLVNHKIIGSYLRNWEKNGSIAIKAKMMAILIIVLGNWYSIVYIIPYLIVKIIVLIIGIVASIYILTRPTAL